MAAFLPAVDELELDAGFRERWARLFSLDGCIGGVRLRFSGSGGDGAVLSWTLSGAAADAPECIGGLPTALAVKAPNISSSAHPCGALAIDHVVLRTTHIEQTASQLAACGLSRRKDIPNLHKGVSAVLFLARNTIVELIGPATTLGSAAAATGEPATAQVWGLTVVVPCVDEGLRNALGQALAGEILGRPRTAVQEGRRIAPLKRDALGPPRTAPQLAFITPRLPKPKL
mmetsp:Transcript_18933/g.61747  ORF Transcript_18933/g.61747 Transcript_18933/m.61747 type:complete len:230 (-) Transcript_18933:9-698(-)